MTYTYLRVSGLGQVDGEGFPRQRSAVESKAQAMGWSIDGTFAEEGVCGAVEGTARPMWTALLGACVAGDRIIVERLDRLARELLVQETMIRDLKARKVQLVSATEDVDTLLDTPERVMIRQILGAVAQLDRTNIVRKLRDSRLRVKAKLGRCEGRKPYGYRPGEVAVLGRMQQLRSSGLSYDAVANSLNAEGFKTRSNSLWNAGTCCKILRREPGCAPAVIADVRSALQNLGCSRSEAAGLAGGIEPGLGSKLP